MTKAKSKHATLSEVARKAGVGTTTVSRVINGGQSVDPKTLARVQRAIESLGYMPNQAARSLKGDRTRSIGFIIPSIADPFFSSCAEAAQAIAHAHDSLLIVLPTQNDTKAEMDAINVLLRHRVDGFIIAPADSGSVELRNRVLRLPIPVVALDRPIAGSAVPSVLCDNFAGARLGTRHLLEHGYKRILCLTGETGLFTIQERIRGYHEAMQEAGLQATVDTSIKDHHSAEQVFERLFHDGLPPEAIFTLKNRTTIDTFEILQKHNIRIPETIALLGYDDFQLAETVRPSISVIQQPIDELGHIAAQILFRRLLEPQDHRSPEQGGVELKTKLIRRASCGCTPTTT